MEILKVIDENNNDIRDEQKDIIHTEGLRHRIAAALVKNDDKFLITTAADYKVEAGGLYHSVGGHVLSTETYEETAIRETEEETGLKIESTDLKLIATYWFEKDYETRKEKERFQVYEINYRPDMGQIKLNHEHYNEQWLSLEDLKKIYDNNPEKFSNPLKMTVSKLISES